MIEKLRNRDAPAHVKVRPVCQESCIFFAYGQKNIAEFLEVERPISVCIMSSEQQVDIIMSELVETKWFFQSRNDILHRNVSAATAIEYFEGI